MSGRARRHRGVALIALSAFSAAAAACGGGGVPLPDLSPSAVGDTAGLVARGRYIVRDVAVCGGCHAADPRDPDGPLSGGLEFKDWRLGTIRAANLTPDSATGLGAWSAPEVVRAIRSGERRGGGVLAPIMPYTWLHGLSDRDALAVARYLETLPPVQKSVKDDHSLAYAFGKAFIKPVTSPVEAAPPRGATAEYGGYLARHVALCVDCHTPRGGLTSAPRLDRLFAGTASPPKDFPANPANLTPDSATGIGRWSEEDFLRTLRTGVDPRGDTLNPFMPWRQLRRMTDDDLRAIYRYLRTLPPVFNTVPRRVAAPVAPAPGTAPGAQGGPIPGFYLGADISAFDSPGRRRPMPPYQEDGQRSDEATILMRHGWTAYRLRVFVSPVREAPDNSLANTLPLARRIKAAGGLLLLDIHYSDTWADPQHQEIPVAWRGLDFDGLEKQVESYSRETIKAFRDAGAMPDWVQVGNEITRGALWPMAQVNAPGQTRYLAPEPYDSVRQWDHLTRILKAGVRGVKEGAGGAPPRIAIHIDRGGDWATTKWFFDHVEAAQVPYDIIAQSFYPPWRHGSLEDLWDNMQQSDRRYHKDFLVAETGYEPSHGPGDNPFMLWPVTPAGRLQFMVDLVNTVRKAPRGIGVMYWQPEWDVWNADGTPGPAVFTLDHLQDLAARPASHAPAAVNP